MLTLYFNITAAHSSCVPLALSRILGPAGVVAAQMATRAAGTIEQVGEGCEIT